MKEKIFSAFKSALLINGKTSISDKTLNTFIDTIGTQITDESQIEDVVKSHIPVLQEIQANINSVAAESAKAAKGKNPQAQPTPPTIDPPKEESEIGKLIAEAIASAITPLKQSLDALNGEKVHTSLSQKLFESLKAKNIPEWYYTDILEGRTFGSDEDVETWGSKIADKWAVRNQEIANNGFNNAVPPSSGGVMVNESSSIASLIRKGGEVIEVEQQKQN